MDEVDPPPEEAVTVRVAVARAARTRDGLAALRGVAPRRAAGKAASVVPERCPARWALAPEWVVRGVFATATACGE